MQVIVSSHLSYFFNEKIKGAFVLNENKENFYNHFMANVTYRDC